MAWLNRRPGEIQSVRLEPEGGGEAWPIALDPASPKLDGRRALLEANITAAILRSLELERALTVVVTSPNGASQRYHVPARGASIGVPMFRACVKSVTDDPPKYLFQPGRPFLGSYKAGESCEFGQIIELQDIPVLVTMSADADGGRFDFHRNLTTRNPHGPFRKRKTPDRIEAQKLFGNGFDLVEEYRYDISVDQLNELAAELSRGETRKISLTTPEGAKSTLEFGGRLGKPFAAMFAACRKARFATEAKGTR